MRKLVAIAMLLIAAICIVGYTRSADHPKSGGVRTGFLVGALLTSGASWYLFQKAGS
jgi:hypothetical protein